MADSTAAQHTITAADAASTNATQPILSLSAKAKLITRFLIDDTTLPDYLKRYGRLLLVVTTGAVAASALYYLFQRLRNDRAKIQIAVFHVLRMIDNLPDLQERLYDPHNLIADIDTEVSRMIGLHLSNDEVSDVMKELKRKVWILVDEERALVAKRRKSSASSDEVSNTKEEHGKLLAEPRVKLAQASKDVVIVAEAASLPSSERDIQEQLLLEEEEQDVSMLDVDDLVPILQTSSSPGQIQLPTSSIGVADSVPILPTSPSPSQLQLPTSSVDRSTYKFSFVSDFDDEISSPSPAPRHKSPASSSYGLYCDDDELYSPDRSPTTSANISPSKQQHLPSAVTKKPTSLLEAATLRAFDPNAVGNHPYKSPVLARPKIMKPASTIKIQPPPNTMAVKTRSEKNGTWLVPITEGISPQISPPDNATEYRVAESRKYYNNVVSARKERRTIRHFFKQGSESEQMQQKQAIVAPVTKDQDWPDPVLTYSSNSEDDGHVETNESTSPQPIDSSPSAPETSPPLPSPPSKSHTPEISSPNFPLIPSSPQCGANLPPLIEAQTSSATTCIARTFKESQTPTSAMTAPRIVGGSSPVILVKSPPEPIPPSPLSKKRGRPKKVIGESQTTMTPLLSVKKCDRPGKVLGESQTPTNPSPPVKKRGSSEEDGWAATNAL